MTNFYLKDVELRNKPTLIVVGILLEVGAVLAQIYLPKYTGVIVCIILLVLGASIIIKAARIRKDFAGESNEQIALKDSCNVVWKDKNGNIKDID